MGKERFEKIYSQGKLKNITQIWVDRETGVHYLFHDGGCGGGITPLLDKDGKPVVSRESLSTSRELL